MPINGRELARLRVLLGGGGGSGGNEAPTRIEWDGNTEGLPSLLGVAYKVSDLILTEDHIKGATFTVLRDGEITETVIDDSMWDTLVQYGMVTEQFIMYPETGFIAVQVACEIEGAPAEPGVYFVRQSDEWYVNSLEFAAAPESGGGVEIATCTMRFMDEYNGKTPPSGMAHGELMGGYHYLQYKDGVLSLVSSEDYGGASDFDITLENVVCGSHVVFGWTFYEGDFGEISFEGAGSNMETLLSDPSRAINETTIFKAPSEPNAVCTVKFRGETDSWIGA